MYSRIENRECLRLYSKAFGNRSDLIIVSSDNIETNNSLLHCGLHGLGDLSDEYRMCKRSNTFSCKSLAWNSFGDEAKQESAISHWNIVGYQVNHSMVSYRPTEKLCKVFYSFRIMLSRWKCEGLWLQTNHVAAVCIFNYLQCLCIIATTIRYSRRSESPISVLGGALASF